MEPYSQTLLFYCIRGKANIGHLQQNTLAPIRRDLKQLGTALPQLHHLLF